MDDQPRRSRVLTYLGWIHVALGIYLPASMLLPLPSSWTIAQNYKQLSEPLYLCTAGETLLLGALSILGGILVVLRRPVAPLIATLAGTAIVVDAIYVLYIWGESNLLLIGTTATEPKYFKIAVTYTAMLVLECLRGGAWLTTLGALARKNVQGEFPRSRPELTTATFSAWVAISAFVSGLFKAWCWMLGSVF